MSETRIAALPLNGHANCNADVGAHLRQQADWIEADEFGDVRNVFIVIETTDGRLIRQTCGAPCDRARAVGILAIASARASVSDE
ncbi:hypothetical protein WK59_03915 [Burkholderia ubonensis]|uniref:hypothetical protein n=1 Tax=Burkholderia ubonensis TaxID=101571 RepID=UPI00075D3B55|nr:hypothetical protein [Burkholderia ubonensis]KVO05581.1 hypothetical protein WJ69_23055 [Burkholderia ubonensis]KVT91891.1 hypothetical protein WK59_03915 [Burkholderia ubonensis]